MLTSLANKFFHSQHMHCVWQVYMGTGFLTRHERVKCVVWPYAHMVFAVTKNYF